VVAQTARRLMVMYAGSVVESGDTQDVFARLAHPYTRALFAARPRLGLPRGSRLATIPGLVPELADLPTGCAFAERCGHVREVCRSTWPALTAVHGGVDHQARCVRLAELDQDRAEVARG
jgi:peptide/nickel transport system ATP-binding protein